MESLFLINPKRKRRKVSRKGRMPAGLRRYWAKHRRGRKVAKRRRRHAVVAVAPRRRKRRAVMRNPHRRKHRYARRKVMRNPRRRHTMRNPFSVRGLTHTLMPAAIGAGGAIALDVVYAYASPFLPASMQTGLVSAVVKLAGAIGLGIGARKFLGREKGNAIALGALTVTGYGVIKPLIAQFAPTIKGLSGFADYIDYGYSPNQGISGMGAYLPNRSMAGLGFYSPAAVIQPQAGMGAYLPGSGVGRLAGDYSNYSYDWSNDGM